MVSARYWRLRGIVPYAGADLEISELHAYNNATRLSGELRSSHAPVVGLLSSLSDADLQTACRFSALDAHSPGFWLQWDFGTAVEVNFLRLGSTSNEGGFLSSATLYASNDSVTWEAVGAQGGFPWPGINQMTAMPEGGDVDSATTVLTNNGPPVVDVANAFPVVLTGNANVDTENLALGQTSVRFSGGYIAIGTAADFNFGTQPFTIEGWFYLTSTTGDGAIFTRRVEAVVSPFELRVSNSGALGAFMAGAWGTTLLSGMTMPKNQWVHIAMAGDGTTVRLFVDGVVAPNTANQSLMSGSTPGPLYVARGGDGAMYGYCGQIRVSSICRYLTSFTPPETFAGFSVPVDPLPIRTPAGVPPVAASTTVAEPTVAGPAHVRTARDVEFGGAGRIWGTAETEIAPGTRVPTKARISLLRQRDRLLAREVWSDPVTGAWEVQGLDTAQQFIALAQDPSGAYRPVAADQTTPEATP